MMFAKPSAATLWAMKPGESAVFVGKHKIDSIVQSTASRRGGHFTVARAWIVPQHGEPLPCVIATCQRPMLPAGRRGRRTDK